jgi:hypothetical protein
MTIEQLITTKSKEEIAFIIYNKCYYCRSHFCKDEYGTYKCEDPNTEKYCRQMFEEFLQKKLE